MMDLKLQITQKKRRSTHVRILNNFSKTNEVWERTALWSKLQPSREPSSDKMCHHASHFIGTFEQKIRFKSRICSYLQLHFFLILLGNVSTTVFAKNLDRTLQNNTLGALVKSNVSPFIEVNYSTISTPFINKYANDFHFSTTLRYDTLVKAAKLVSRTRMDA